MARVRSGLPLVFFALCAGAVASAPGRSCAQSALPDEEQRSDEPPTIALIPFGAKVPADADRLAASCNAALLRLRGVRVLPPERWRKEDAESGEGSDLEAMARRLGANLLVTGSLSGSGEDLKLLMDVFGANGLPIGSFTVPLLEPRLGPAADFLLEDELARIVRPALGLRPPSPYPRVKDQEEPTPQLADKEDPIQALLRRQREAAAKAPPPRPPWRAVIEAEVTGLVSARSFGCGPAMASRRNLACVQDPYPLDIGGGGRLAATFFPLALKRSLPAAVTGIGLKASVELPYWPTRLSSSDPTVEFPVSELRGEVGPWWRMAFGGGAAKPVLELGAMYSYHRFTLSGGQRPAPLPDAVYQHIVPTLGLGVWLGDRVFLRAHGAYLAVLSAGPLLEAVTAASSSPQNPLGTGSAQGFRGALLFDARVYRKLIFTMGGSVDRVSLSLNGDGCSKNDPRQSQCLMDAADLAVRNAADLSLSAWLGLGLRM